jgi:RHH-type proline utilization regulon transcriptional repressor/proline dehydrogenase/delta 1-pyrroline-5-carboxylate dehydrogenase
VILESTTLEPAIERIGRRLADDSARQGPTVFDRRWWSNSLLEWAMKDERFKVRLFRFIDVLPAVREDGRVAELIEEYFGDLASSAAPLGWGLRAMSATKLGGRLTARSLRQQIMQMAKIFIAGASVADAEAKLAELWKNGRGYSIDLLGEASVSEPEADRYRDRCLEALTQLERAASAWPGHTLLEHDHLGPLPRVHLSIKLSALYSQLDPIDPDSAYEATSTRLRPLLDLAKRMPAAITFDMEHAEIKDLILAIFMRVLDEPEYRSYPHAGIALQAYVKESERDLADLIAWAERRGSPVTLRLVKGAYWDSEMIRYRQRGWPVPVFRLKHETDANYERLTRVLVQHTDCIRPAFGSHNLRSIAHAAAAAEAAGLTPETCEYQMIFGMAEPLQAAVAKLGRRVRVYTPVGELIPGMAYLVRRLLENTSNESFLRKEYTDKEPLEKLMRAPDVPAAAHDAAPGTPEPENGFRNEPHTDFSYSEARREMSRAIAAAQREFGQVRSSRLGDGRALSGPVVEVRDPSDPSCVIGRVSTCTAADADGAVQIAIDAMGAWASTPPDTRAEILVKAARIVRRRRFDLAAWEIFETGKPWREADADVAEAIDFLEFYARDMRRLGQPERLGHAPGELNERVYAPRGVAVVIAPWNFPLAIPTGMVSAALVTGNTVLFKPSERASLAGVLLGSILHEAGVPSSVLQVLPGGPEVGEALVTHPDVAVIAFTGSKEIGLRIYQHSAQVSEDQRFVKRVIAEMGGKNAIIVDETADLDEAVVGVLASFTGYQGQKCSACSRVIVHDSAYDLFLQRLVDAATSLRIGPPRDPRHTVGPMIDDRAREKVRRYVEIGTREGRVAYTKKVDHPGYFVGPTIIADVPPEARLAKEEIFGPVLAVMRAQSFDEALRLANNSCYALTGGLYSRSPANIHSARAAFDVGNLYINRPITGALVSRQPFGGHRLSGMGAKAGGEEYLSQFMVARVVTENTMRRGFAPSEWNEDR